MQRSTFTPGPTGTSGTSGTSGAAGRHSGRAGSGGVTPGTLHALALATQTLQSIRAQIHALHALEAVVLATGDAIAEQINTETRARDHGELAHRAVAAELGCAVRESDRTIAAKTGRAVTLVRDYPAVHAALSAGRISLAHAHLITDTGHIVHDTPAQPDARARYTAAALQITETEMVGRARPLVRGLAERFAARNLTDRHRDAHARRLVIVKDLDDGMAELTAVLSAPYAYGIKDRLTQIARHVHNTETTDRTATQSAAADGTGATFRVNSAGATIPVTDLTARTLDQVRADLFTDMLLTTDPTQLAATGRATGIGALTARVQVIVPHTRVTPHPTATKPPTATTNTATTDTVADAAAELAGYGPIDTDTARRIAGGAPHWEHVHTDHTSGDIITVDTYRPSAHLRRFLGARDLHCRFPGCRTPLARCDIDHTIDAAHGGPTSNPNLAHLCRRHHTLKHHSTWNTTQDIDGTLHWRSPTGRTYPEPPPSRVRFHTTHTPPPTPPPAPTPPPPPKPEHHPENHPENNHQPF